MIPNWQASSSVSPIQRPKSLVYQPAMALSCPILDSCGHRPHLLHPETRALIERTYTNNTNRGAEPPFP